MTVNAGPEYFAAEKRYFAAKTLEDQMLWLEEMIRAAPKHKSSESFVANLKQRLKKLQEKQEKSKKSGGGKKGLRKEGFQCALFGFTNAGKSSLLAKLTNAKPRIDSYAYTTKFPEVGTMDYGGVKAQIVDLPSFGSEAFDIGIINTADCVLLVVDKVEDIKKLRESLDRARGKIIHIINKIDLIGEDNERKFKDNLKSKKIDAVLVSCVDNLGIEELKARIFKEMNVIRVYTKEPGKQSTGIPVVLKPNSTVKDVAEAIRKGFYTQVAETKVSGPSAKFPNQKVGLAHVLKDKDTVEFHTR